MLHGSRSEQAFPRTSPEWIYNSAAVLRDQGKVLFFRVTSPIQPPPLSRVLTPATSLTSSSPAFLLLPTIIKAAMTTTTTIFLKSETPLSPLHPHPPIMQHTAQSLVEAEAEAEAEVEMFRRQAYAIRGLVYPGPRPVYTRGSTLLPAHKRPSLTKSCSLPSTKRPKGMGAGQVCASTCMFPPIIILYPQSKLTFISASSKPSSTEDTFASQQPSFARLVEDLLRTHSSTASPYGQHLSHEIFNDNVYLGSFYPIPSSSSGSSINGED